MVSLLEQYETETSQSPLIDSSADLNNPFRSGFIQASLNSAENEDIFKSTKVQINIHDKKIDQFEQCSGQMVMLFKPKTIRFLNPKTKTDETYDAPDSVNRLFLDKTGKHLFVATESNEFYYFSKSSKKFRAISKLKSNLVTAIGWNKNSNEKTTDAILVGTKKGSLYELCINTNNEGFLNTTIDTYCKLVYSLNKDSIITGIEIFHLNNNSIENIYDIVITTPKRLYEFIGSDASNSVSGNTLVASSSLSTSPASSPIFASIFTYYETKNIKELANYFEMPGDIGYSQLLVRENLKIKKKTLAWMTGGGILTYEMDPISMIKFSALTIQNDLLKRLINETNQEIISYPQVKDDYLQDNQDLPIGICLTEFHLAIFYKSNVKIICLLNKELVYNQKFDTKSIGGKSIGVWCDPDSGDFGCYTNRTIIKILTIKESRKIWRIYLSKNEFELAKQYCRENPANLNLVLTRQAEYLFNNKKYNESAFYYAQTQNSFEEICLKYLELGDMTALRRFLSYKLNSLDSEREITQTTVVIAYIIEIFLNQLADTLQEKLYDEHDSLHKEFYKFLDNSKVKTCLKESKEAIYKIFASHGNMDDLVYFAEAMKDYPQIITHYLQEENYRKALEALSKQNNIEIFYKYSPIFFELLPKEMVDLWIKFGNQLNPSKLLPSMASCCHSEEQANEAMRFLEYCINRFNSEDQSIHNSLLSLYLQHNSEKLLEYVKQRKDGSNIYFDKLMLARLCTERDDIFLKEACVYLYRIMGWYEEAVDLALGLNVELAREVANSVNSDDFSFSTVSNSQTEELKKVLWLRIARHVIEKENDVNKAMEFLQDLNDTIAIEDVLPYFPDFVTIDQFKDSIRSSLAAYTEKIHFLKENIDQAASSAQLIRADIQNIRQKSIIVNSSDSCSECKFRLMTRRFYVFPCGHKFHGDCLYQTSKYYLLASKQRRIEELHKLLDEIKTMPVISSVASQASSPQHQSSIVGSVTSGMTNAVISHFSKQTNKTAQPQTYSNVEIAQLKTELDELLAMECPWCGERILRTIDEPFIDPLKYQEVFDSWL